jgi:hypothetical protein
MKILPTKLVPSLIFGIVLALNYGGCWTGEGPPSEHDRRSESSIANESPEAGSPGSKIDVRSIPDGACSRGEVQLDRPSGSVQFIAVCVGRGKPRPVAIGLARRVQHYPGRSVGIVGFAKVAEVRGSHAGERGSVRCRMRQGFVWCPLKVSARGRTTLTGRAWIRKQRVCEDILSVISSESVGVNIRSGQLFNDLPRGCPVAAGTG